MTYLGDYNTSDTIYFNFTTVTTTGAPTQLAGTPAISCFKDNSATPDTDGITLTVDLNSVTGLNNVAIDTSADGTFYSTATDFSVVITTGTVGGTSVVGYVVATFSLQNRSSLRPTTAGRTLDVSAGGEAGVDWANVGTPGSTVSLSATTVATTTDVTNQVTANATAISGDSVAADNLEAEYDGTGYKSYLRRNTAQAGAAGSITLDASASASDDYYLNTHIAILSGTGAGQYRLCTAYNGTSKVASTKPNWVTNPDATSVFAVFPTGYVEAFEIVGGSATSGSNSRDFWDNGTMIDNLEAFFDGTGYNAANSTVGTVTTVTNEVTADMTKISGDSTAADNCELFFDGTGYNASNSEIGTVATATALTTNNDKTGYSIADATSDAVIADAVWNAATATYGTAGTYGEALEAVDTTSVTVTTNNDKTGYSLSAGGVDAIWDEVQSGHVTAGTFGLYLDMQSSLISTGGLSAATIADAVWDEAKANHTTADTYGAYLDQKVSLTDTGAGAVAFTYTVTDSSNNQPIDGAEVWVTTDSGGTNIVAGTSTTNAQGEVTFYLDPATYYFWTKKAGYNFTNPDTEIVSAS